MANQRLQRIAKQHPEAFERVARIENDELESIMLNVLTQVESESNTNQANA